MENERYINPGIDTLIELGFINRLVIARGTEPKGARNGILNCLGCRLVNEEGVSCSEIVKCSGEDQTQVSMTLNKLEKAGLLVAEKAPNSSSPGFNRVYTISETSGGLALRQTIGVPPECGLEK